MAGPILQPHTVVNVGVRPERQSLAERVDSLLCANLNEIGICEEGDGLEVKFTMDDSSVLAIRVRGTNVTITTASGCTEGAH